MYQYTGAVVKLGFEWTRTDISGVTLKDLTRQGGRVFIEVKNSTKDISEILELANIREQVENYDKDIINWLTENGNNALPVKIGELSELIKEGVVVSDIKNSNFTTLSANHNIHQDPRELKKSFGNRDLFLFNEDVDHREIVRTSLISVNGLIHPLTTNETGIFVHEGMVSGELSGKYQCSLINFSNLGEFQRVYFSDEMFKSDAGKDLKESFYLNVGVDLKDKLVMFVIGGYLIELGELMDVVSDKTLKVEFGKYPIVDRLIRASTQLASDSLTALDQVNGIGSLNSVLSDDAIKNLLINPFSYMLVFDGTKVIRTETTIPYMGIPGKFESKEKPAGVIFNIDGTVADAFVEALDSCYRIHTDTVPNNDYRHKTLPTSKQTFISASKGTHTKYQATHVKMVNYLAVDI